MVMKVIVVIAAGTLPVIKIHGSHKEVHVLSSASCCGRKECLVFQSLNCQSKRMTDTLFYYHLILADFLFSGEILGDINVVKFTKSQLFSLLKLQLNFRRDALRSIYL